MTDVLTDLESQRVPKSVVEALRRLREDVARLAGPNVVGMVLYGSVVRGRYRPGHSDVDLAIVLRDARPAALEALAPALRTAFRAVRLEPFILALDELHAVAQVFPVKLLSIQERHRVLSGEDPFHGLRVSGEHLRVRIEMELRNLALRLRRRFVATSDDASGLLAMLASTAVPLSLELEGLLRLLQKPVPSDDSPSSLLGAAATELGLDAAALATVARLKDGAPVEEDPVGLFGRVVESVARAAELAKQLEGRA
jgi:predicted nucleotidyltransferase